MSLSDYLFGRPLATDEEGEQRVGVWAGIPMLGLDALGSAAYGPEAALTLLIPLGAAGIGYIGPISTLIIALLFVVYISYRQTISAYPHGGGSYTVARENLGTTAGLLAAAALMLDYVLVVAVGISAGVGALVSAAPTLQPYMLPLCLVILTMITAVNLRGVRESGLAFLVPTYLFIVSMLAVLGVGVGKAVLSGGRPVPLEPPAPQGSAEAAAGLWVLMRAFASGCTAMTGVEAVSNGVSAFHEPTVKYARGTLTAIIGLLAVMLAGIAFLCRAYGVGATEPGGPGYQSVLSQLVAAVVGRGAFYYVTIGSVLGVLSLSANTGFADFPRLCRVVAQDGYLPNGFAHRGRRLVYSWGIFVLAALSASLLIAFGGITDHLIPLFAVGAFLAFTLSQAGMVVHWRREGGPNARRSAAINAVGAVCTALTLVIVLVSKFAEGAWIMVLLVPALLACFAFVNAHYRTVGREVATDLPLNATDLRPPLALLPVRGWSAITRKALRFALKVSDEVYALHIADDENAMLALEEGWERNVREPCRSAGVNPPKLIVVYSPYRRLYSPLRQVVSELQKTHPRRDVAVIVPQLVRTRWYHFLLHNQTASVIKVYLLLSGFRRVVVIDVPWYLSDSLPPAAPADAASSPAQPGRIRDEGPTGP
ncbi:Putrescine importer PuuP [Aquisphaera giovannonii]|uniref:Putrescine importer PuuP n=1 Tax=Aquisphaera giovannonii TaxID=406548 RepID=A0A5B9W1R1_9BACT|nr:APC family permease [Aquisphaera giovannonii]QEH34483.1 Putrescine importer PuuP [Aquisphaera giovannonii]